MNSSTAKGGFEELERSGREALATYSNVHRGSGHNSMATTHLYEQARNIVLDYLGLEKKQYAVIFCSTAGSADLISKLGKENFKVLSGSDTGLCLGVTAVAVKRKALRSVTPFISGGGTATLIGHDWVLWADGPDRFEAGTPAIINVIAFAKALQIISRNGKTPFTNQSGASSSAKEILYNDGLESYSGRELLDKLRQTLIGRDIIVPTTKGERPFINLDNAASTPTFEPVWDVVCKTWKQPLEVQKEIMVEVRKLVSEFLGAPPENYELVFTSNATEAINLAAGKLGRESFPDTETVVLNTLLEHSSNELPWRTHPGLSLIRLGVDDEGMMDLAEMETLLREYNQDLKHGKQRIRLVAVSGASNVLGSFNNLEEISSIVHRYGARLLVDAAQMVAHRKVDMQAGDFDYLAFSAHKVYAPFGAGALLVKKGPPGFSPEETSAIRASGEENAAGIAALGKALYLLKRIGLDVIHEEEQELTAYALRKLAQVPGIKIFGIKDPGSPLFSRKGGVIMFALKEMMANRLAKELALKGGIGVRSGCHCAHLIIKHLLHFTPTLSWIQRTIVTLFPAIVLPGLLRISFGIENSPKDIDKLISVLEEIGAKTRIASVPLSEAKKQMKTFVGAAFVRVYG